MPRPQHASAPVSPPVWYQPDADKDALRFASMSVTRNPTGALIPNDRKEIRPRVSEPLEGLQRVRIARAPPGPEQDVEGSHPRPLHVASTGHRDPLDTTDISGTQTRSRVAGLVTTREVNPLSPAYVLPGSTRPQAPHDVPPFKRDLGAVDDIPGAKPTPLYADRPVRLSSAPVPRATSSIRERRGPFPDVLDVTDINRDGKFVSKRTTNPLDPSYVHHGDVIADEPGAHYVPKYHERRAGSAAAASSASTGALPFLPLTTADIEGARPGESADSRVGCVPRERRRDFATTNFLGDIAGARAGTHRSGLPERSVVTDPNARDYLLLDGTRSSAVYASTGVGLSAYGLAASELAATGGAVPGAEGAAAEAAAAPVRRRTRIDPRDAEILALRRQVEQLTRTAHAPVGGDPFLDVAAAAEAASGRAAATKASSSAAAVDALVATGGSERSAAPAAVSARTAAAAAASVATSAPALQNNQSSQPSSDPESSQVSAQPAPAVVRLPRGRKSGAGGAGAAVASVTAIATGHAASSDPTELKFSSMSKAMVLAKKYAGPAGPSLPAGGGQGASYAGGLSARLASVARAAEIAAVRGLPG